MIYSARLKAASLKPASLKPTSLKPTSLKPTSLEPVSRQPAPEKRRAPLPVGPSPTVADDLSGRRQPPTHRREAESPDSATPLVRAQLENRIRRRIEARLPTRIRNLGVTARDNGVILSGECNTYYTKQLAQHVAMGILEYEQLINNIGVRSLT